MLPGTVASDETSRRAPRTGWFVAGQKIGTRYTIIKLLGVGGMGAVYQAWDDELMLAVAIKVIIPAGGVEPGTRHEA
jgi:serine/threonine protein kinase